MSTVLNVDIPPRVETGAIKFIYNNGEADWNGLFIRGDSAFAVMLAIRSIEKHFADNPAPELMFTLQELSGLRELIEGEVIEGFK